VLCVVNDANPCCVDCSCSTSSCVVPNPWASGVLLLQTETS
jgi:hypothetical protein